MINTVDVNCALSDSLTPKSHVISSSRSLTSCHQASAAPSVYYIMSLRLLLLSV